MADKCSISCYSENKEKYYFCMKRGNLYEEKKEREK